MVEETQITQNLMKSFKFSDYEVEDWLTQVLNSKSNTEFKTLIEANSFMTKIVDHFKLGYEEECIQKNSVIPEQYEESKKDEVKEIISETLPELIEKKQSELLEELETFVKSTLESELKDSKSYVTMVLFLFSLYIRENSLGPSVYTQYVQETLAPLDTSGPLPENVLDPISFKNKTL